MNYLGCQVLDAVPLRVELSVVAREGLGQRHLGRVAPRDDGQEISTVIVFCSPINMGKGCVSAILSHLFARNRLM